jgi:hypothetical protein
MLLTGYVCEDESDWLNNIYDYDEANEAPITLDYGDRPSHPLLYEECSSDVTWHINGVEENYLTDLAITETIFSGETISLEDKEDWGFTQSMANTYTFEGEAGMEITASLTYESGNYLDLILVGPDDCVISIIGIPDCTVESQDERCISMRYELPESGTYKLIVGNDWETVEYKIDAQMEGAENILSVSSLGDKLEVTYNQLIEGSLERNVNE